MPKLQSISRGELGKDAARQAREGGKEIEQKRGMGLEGLKTGKQKRGRKKTGGKVADGGTTQVDGRDRRNYLWGCDGEGKRQNGDRTGEER